MLDISKMLKIPEQSGEMWNGIVAEVSKSLGTSCFSTLPPKHMEILTTERLPIRECNPVQTFPPKWIISASLDTDSGVFQ